MKRPYIIHMMDYCIDSGGTRTLHKLCHTLNQKGYDAYMTCRQLCPELNTKTTYGNKELFLSVMKQDAVVVYPEFFAREGNSLGSKHPVGYQGGLFGEFGPEMHIIFSHLPVFQRRNSPQLFINVIEFDMFNSKDCPERNVEAVWGGKGDIGKLPGMQFENLHYIGYNRDDIARKLRYRPHVPVKDRRHIAETLRRSKLLYSFDSMSAVITEARLCGCPVTWIPNGGNWAGAVLCSYDLWTNGNATLSCTGLAKTNTPEDIEKARAEVHLFEAEYKKFCEREDSDIENFIGITQSM